MSIFKVQPINGGRKKARLINEQLSPLFKVTDPFPQEAWVVRNFIVDEKWGELASKFVNDSNYKDALMSKTEDLLKNIFDFPIDPLLIGKRPCMIVGPHDADENGQNFHYDTFGLKTYADYERDLYATKDDINSVVMIISLADYTPGTKYSKKNSMKVSKDGTPSLFSRGSDCRDSTESGDFSTWLMKGDANFHLVDWTCHAGPIRSNPVLQVLFFSVNIEEIVKRITDIGKRIS